MLKPENYYNSERPEMLGLVPSRRTRVLEIGCGEGGFMSTLTGVEESWGIEPSPAAELAKRHFTRVLEGTFDEAKGMLPIRHFDLVICNDVIEHMLDHMTFISSLKN